MMDAIEFNQKWKSRLEEGHYGLDIDTPEIVNYVDTQFKVLDLLYPDFKYSQIKIKYGKARVYLSGDVPQSVTTIIEEAIDKLLGL